MRANGSRADGGRTGGGYNNWHVADSLIVAVEIIPQQSMEYQQGAHGPPARACVEMRNPAANFSANLGVHRIRLEHFIQGSKRRHAPLRSACMTTSER